MLYTIFLTYGIFKCTDTSVLIASHSSFYKRYAFYCVRSLCLWKFQQGIERTTMGREEVVTVLSSEHFKMVLAHHFVYSIAVIYNCTTFHCFVFVVFEEEQKVYDWREIAFLNARKWQVCQFLACCSSENRNGMVENFRSVCSKENLSSSVWKQNKVHCPVMSVFHLHYITTRENWFSYYKAFLCNFSELWYISVYGCSHSNCCLQDIILAVCFSLYFYASLVKIRP